MAHRFRGVITAVPGKLLRGAARKVTSSWFATWKDAEDWLYAMQQPNMASVTVEADKGRIDISKGGKSVRRGNPPKRNSSGSVDRANPRKGRTKNPFLHFHRFYVSCDGKKFGPYITKAKARKVAMTMARVMDKPAKILGEVAGGSGKRNPLVLWKVYLHGKLIDEINDNYATSADEVKRSLVDDGYDPSIVVKKEKSKSKKVA
jgi:hypothetical protein